MAETKEKKGKSKRKINPSFKFRMKFLNAFRGIAIAMREESTLFIYLLMTIFAILMGIWVKLDTIRWVLLIILISVLFAIEFINTAIENFVDLLSFEYNTRAKKIKDICAGASVLNSLFSVVVGILIFYEPLIEKFKGLT